MKKGTTETKMSTVSAVPVLAFTIRTPRSEREPKCKERRE